MRPKQRFYPLLLALLAALLSACEWRPMSNHGNDETAAAPPADAVAVVNGRAITRPQFEAYKEQRQRMQPGRPIDEQQVLNDLIGVELAAQDAEKKGARDKPEVAAALEMQERNALANLGVRMALEDPPIDEAALRKAYDERTQGGTETEYKARHILVETEEEARAIIAELDNGADFATLAKERSKGPSGPQGGDLGWFTPGQMVPTFSEAVKSLEKGAYTKEPVKTQFGWHVVLLEDKRERPAASFDELAPRLRAEMQNQRIQNYIENLRANAQIEIKNPPAPPAPAAAPAAAPEPPPAPTTAPASNDAGAE